ncbi:DUF3800 domain-containing protein [Actinokineospora guangxiensis]|uniref:DUF3800 domain-containing protein n=1 Tax=Actinokineospora guangxiensis TaxID=1490288 RepID=A0ABW0ELQ2_9PSEU
MRLIYVDESYCKACYYVVALLVPETSVRPLGAALDTVVIDASWGYGGINSQAELHGYDLFHAQRDWEPLKTMARARIGIYGKALQAIADHDVRVIIRGVMSRRLVQRYGERASHPHSVTLWHLLERCDEYLEQVGDVGLAIADEPGQADQQPEYRKSLRDFQLTGTRGYRSRQITRIVDTIYFAPSTASRLVQAADLIAFLHHRMETETNTDTRVVKANNALWARIAPRVIHSRCWIP